MDYQRRELTHACSRSDTEACDMCYVFNVNLMTDGLNAVWSNDRAAPTDTNPNNLELAPPQSVTATRLDQLFYSPNYYIQIFQTQPFARSEDWTLNLHARSYQVQRVYGSYVEFRNHLVCHVLQSVRMTTKIDWWFTLSCIIGYLMIREINAWIQLWSANECIAMCCCNVSCLVL